MFLQPENCQIRRCAPEVIRLGSFYICPPSYTSFNFNYCSSIDQSLLTRFEIFLQQGDK